MSTRHERRAGTLAVGAILCLVAVAAAGILLAACGSSTSTGSSPAPAASSSTGTGTSNAGDVKIGFVGDLSGGQAADGTTLLAAVKAYAMEVNAAGGLNGKHVDVLVEDGATDPTTSNEKAKQLLAQNVDVVIGPILSSARNAVYPTVTGAGKIFLYGSLYEGNAYDKLMFITGEVPQQQVSKFAPWLAENDGKTAWLIGSDYIWPRRENKWFHQYFEAAGGKVLGEQYVAMGTTDFSSLITKIAAAKPAFVFNTLVGADAVAFSKQFYNYGLSKNTHLASIDHFESYIQAIGPQASEGIQVCFGYFQNLQSPANTAFLADYRKFEPKLPASTLTASTYTLLKLWGMGVQKAGTTDSQAVAKAMEGMSMSAADSPIGPITMRATDHHTIRHMYIAVVHDGQFKVVQDLGMIQPGTDQRTAAK